MPTYTVTTAKRSPAPRRPQHHIIVRPDRPSSIVRPEADSAFR
jgi:hypothetical protein